MNILAAAILIRPLKSNKYILIRYGANNLANARLADILYIFGQTELAEDHNGNGIYVFGGY